MNENNFNQDYIAALNLIANLKSLSVFKSDLDNPLLNLGKPTIENVSRVSRLKVKRGKFGLFYNFLIYLPYLGIQLIYNLIHHIKHMPQLRIQNKPRENSDYLFVSHYVGQQINEENGDSFFGNVPTLLSDINKQSTIIYVNHKKKTKELSDNSKNVLLPKTCYTKNRLFITFAAIGKSIFYFKRALRISFSDINKANQLFLLAQLQVNIASFHNQILLINLKTFILKIEPKRIVLTLEGHPYESFISININHYHPETKVILWQLAPVVPKQHGFLETIENLPSSCDVAVTGESIKKFIEQNTLISRKIVVAGSPKFNEIIISNKNGDAILLAPEGSIEAVNEFISLISILCRNFPDREVILRLHPAVKEFFREDFKAKFSDFENFDLSKNTLHEDLLKSEYCVFRSSSVSIEGLKYNIKPIHYSKLTHGELNPLALNQPWIFEAQSATEVTKIIASNPRTDQIFLQETYDNYYTKFNLEKFLEL
jgi:hypothetical protein